MLKDIFKCTSKIYQSHSGWIDTISQEYRQQIIDNANGKYAKCSVRQMQHFHPNYIKIINFFGAQQGFVIMLSEMLDGRNNDRDQEQIQQRKTPQQEGDYNQETNNDNNTKDGSPQPEQLKPDRPPSTLNHHALSCYLVIIAYLHRFLIPVIRASVADYMYKVKIF